MTERNSGGTTINQATYTYDALDRRISLNDNGTWIWTVYDGHNPYADFTGAGSLAMRYLDGGAIDQIFARTNSAGVTAWYLDDHLGSVRDLVSISSGGYTLLDHVEYDPFGNIIQETSSSNGDRYKYAGMEYDSVTGQYYDRARYYNAVTGRFIGQDPSSFAAGDANLYRYVGNNAIIQTDPSGLQSGGGQAGDPPLQEMPPLPSKSLPQAGPPTTPPVPPGSYDPNVTQAGGGSPSKPSLTPEQQKQLDEYNASMEYYNEYKKNYEAALNDYNSKKPTINVGYPWGAQYQMNNANKRRALRKYWYKQNGVPYYNDVVKGYNRNVKLWNALEKSLRKQPGVKPPQLPAYPTKPLETASPPPYPPYDTPDGRLPYANPFTQKPFGGWRPPDPTPRLAL